jgi:DNA-binding XRE family transcriptional regulator
MSADHYRTKSFRGAPGITKVSRPSPPNLHPLIVKLRMRRLSTGMMQTELAQKIGCSSNSLVKWERGKCIPNALNLIDWANALGLRVSLEKDGESDG